MPDQGWGSAPPGRAAVRLPDADADIRAQPAFERPSRPAPDERGGAEAPRLGGRPRGAPRRRGTSLSSARRTAIFRFGVPRHPADGFGPVEQPVGEQPGSRCGGRFPGPFPRPPDSFMAAAGRDPPAGRAGTSISCPSQTIRLTIRSRRLLWRSGTLRGRDPGGAGRRDRPGLKGAPILLEPHRPRQREAPLRPRHRHIEAAALLRIGAPAVIQLPGRGVPDEGDGPVAVPRAPGPAGSRCRAVRRRRSPPGRHVRTPDPWLRGSRAPLHRAPAAATAAWVSSPGGGPRPALRPRAPSPRTRPRSKPRSNRTVFWTFAACWRASGLVRGRRRARHSASLRGCGRSSSRAAAGGRAVPTPGTGAAARRSRAAQPSSSSAGSPSPPERRRSANGVAAGFAGARARRSRAKSSPGSAKNRERSSSAALRSEWGRAR